MKRISCILGSPRVNGNSETISRKVIAKAEELGAEAQVFAVNNMNFKGCQACQGCKTGSDKCITKDDLTEVLDSIADADILIFASPIYFGQLAAQAKAVLDRMYSFLNPGAEEASRLASGKKCIFVFTQGSPNESEHNIFPEMEQWFKMLGFEECHLIRGIGMNDKSAALKDVELLKRAETVAESIMK